MRKSIAALLYLFAFVAFAYSVVEVYDALYGIPDGLTGGRTRVALPGDASLEVKGGFVRRVEGTSIKLRSLSPTPVLSFSNDGREHVSYSVNLINVKPLSMWGAWFLTSAPLGAREPLEFKPADPGVIRFSVQLPPGESRTYAFEQRPQNSASVRLFVFGGVRKGIDTFERLLRIANEESPDFIVGLGDTYYRANVGKILQVDRTMARSGVPVYLIPGEIEYRDQENPSDADDDQLANYYTLDRHHTMFGPGNNVFNFGGWRFVFLENSRTRNRSALRWLRGLPPGDAKAPRTLFFSHIPPFDPRTEIFKEMTTGVPHEHEQVMEQMRQLGTAAAFFGHYHGYAEQDIDGIPCYITSAAGVKLPADQFSHFLDVTLSEDGTVNVVQRSLEHSASHLSRSKMFGPGHRGQEGSS